MFCPVNATESNACRQRSLKVSKIMILDKQSDKVQQLPAAKGAGGRGEALNSAALVQSQLRSDHGMSGNALHAVSPLPLPFHKSVHMYLVHLSSKKTQT